MPDSLRDRSVTSLLDAARLGALHTTPGGRILASVTRPDATGTAYRTELVDLTEDQPLPLTRGAASIGSVALAEDGTTLFTAKRPAEADGESVEDARLWALPPRGEARELLSRPGGVSAIHLADRLLVAEVPVHTQAATEAEHAELSERRTEAKVSAVLHEAFPSRFWDHDLGPGRNVLAVAELPADLWRAVPTPDEAVDGTGVEASSDGTGAESSTGSGPGTPPERLLHLRHLQMPPGRLVDWTADRQGRHALVAMQDSRGELLAVSSVYLLDLTGNDAPRLIAEATATEGYFPGSFSPSGERAVLERSRRWTQEASSATFPLALDIATGAPTPLWPGLDEEVDLIWVDEDTLAGTADDHGRGSVWIGGVDDAEPRRLAGGPDQPLSFADLSVAAGALVASASGIAVAPHPVRIDLATGALTALPNPADEPTTPGSLTEVTATAEDGTTLRSWLRLPDGDGPHPLVVFAHGGPWGSWNAWTFRWNPNPFVAAGYAVLLPDPAISTGYGRAMVDRGQQELGGTPFTDIMALTDTAVARPDIDADRTAFAGGSYGGYMANWVAGHTGDRFRCIVTHASLWDTATMGATTDNAGWEAPMRSQNARFNPKDSVAEIVVPMLVIHGDRDYRVPIAQGHALWYDLHAFSATPRDAEGRTRHRYLYFPDEGHWVQGRGNAEVWYRTVIAFLDEHVLGTATERPATLG